MQLYNWAKAKSILKNDGVIVAPTDTLYGILAKAESKSAIERIYKVKGRDENKPFIVLINKLSDLEKLNIKLNNYQKEFLDKFWPGKVSVILPCLDNKFKYLHRGSKSIAVRMIRPRNRNLFDLIKSVGPLVAPSANPQGEEPAYTVWEAMRYFKGSIDLYLCGGTRKSKPSTLVSYLKSKPIVMRQGEVKIKKD